MLLLAGAVVLSGLPAISPAAPLPAAPGAAAGEWEDLGAAADALVRSMVEGTAGAGRAREGTMRLLEIHAAHAEGFLGRKVPPPRRALVARSLSGLAPPGKSGPRGPALRRVLRNRALFAELLAGSHGLSATGRLLEAFVEAEGRAPAEGAPAAALLADGGPGGGRVSLDAKGSTLSWDLGWAGHGNGVLDSGETVALRPALLLGGAEPLLEARAVLRSGDPRVRVESSETTYASRGLGGGASAGQAPGTVLRPKGEFVLTVHPDCGDGLLLPLELEFREGGRGSVLLRLTLRVRTVGPVVAGPPVLRDGEGPALRGNGNGVAEPGEAGILGIALRNAGTVPLESVAFHAKSGHPLLDCGKGAEPPPSSLPAGAEAVLSAAIGIGIPDGDRPASLLLDAGMTATVEGRSYLWRLPTELALGVTDAEWASTMGEIRAWHEDGDFEAIANTLQGGELRYRLEGEGGAEARRILADALEALGPGYEVSGDIGVGGGAGGIYGGRRSRDRPRRMEGGEGTEAAVAAGLAWLAAHQSADGSWDPEGAAGCCGGGGAGSYRVGLTGLALLAFLGNGETHRTPLHGQVVRRGLDWLLSVQDREGCFGDRTSTRFIYNHALASLALCEAYGMTRSRLFAGGARRGVAFSIACRNPGAAWRYGVRPGENDASITGWMVMVLAAARGADIDPGGCSAAMKEALGFLDGITDPASGRVGYTARGNGPARLPELMDAFPSDRTESLTALGLLARFLGGVPVEDPAAAKGTDLCLRTLPRWDRQAGTIDFYYWFFGTGALFQRGGDPWKRWNGAMREALLPNQEGAAAGHRQGSWAPLDPWGPEGGRIYATAINVLTLEVYYRTARITRGPR